MPGFTHLHTVSGFSMRYGGSHPERLAERAAERGMDALALTDRDTLAGAVRFAKACGPAGIRPLFGVDLAVSPAVFPRTSAGTGTGAGPEVSYRRRTPVKGGAFVDESAPRAVFLARDGAAGWAELCRMVTAAHAGSRPQPALPWEALRGEGVLVLLGPGSEVGRGGGGGGGPPPPPPPPARPGGPGGRPPPP
ncbi:PHP domain-containing protein, partial [Streptomyces goshikiensis]|uniref:PHP domain-containing protein n=1 Tax=Streptomyces goshikiensis TaxID=1942 RepID=UPI00367FF506